MWSCIKSIASSRSLFDFARLMQMFEEQGASFVSVTQQFNSSTPMGRLTLHVLLSFAAVRTGVW